MDQTSVLENHLINEFSHIDLEPRLVRRTQTILETMRKNPSGSFPEIFESTSDLEAAYRYFSNPGITFETLLKAHIQTTLERCQSYQDIFVLEDTTEFSFGGEKVRQGLSRIHTNDQGVLGHVGLAVSADGKRLPLGVLGAELFTRPPKKKTATKRALSHKYRASGDSESCRWERVAHQIETVLEDVSISAIHVMDREGDIYDVLSGGEAKRIRRFVIRANNDRTVESDAPDYSLLTDALDGLSVLY